MNNNKEFDINSQVDKTIEIKSQTSHDIQPKTEVDIQSRVDVAEKEAFLYTAKRNAAIMFSKYL